MKLMRSRVISIFLYARESRTLTTELRKGCKPLRWDVTEGYRTSHTNTISPIRIFVKDPSSNWKPDLGQETKTGVVWPYPMVFWLGKDNPPGHSERKKKKRWQKNVKEWTGMAVASSTRATEDRTKLKGIVVKPSVVPQWPRKVMR